MAIQSAGLALGNCAGSSINERFEKTLYRVYVVVADLTDSEDFVRANFGAGLSPPVTLFSGHPDDAFARCRSISADFQEKFNDDGTMRALWVVRAEWGYINPFEAATSGDPADIPIRVTIEGIKTEKPADFDIHDNPIVNSAGDPYDPPVIREQLACVIKIERKEKSLAPAQILAFANKVNSAPWQGLDQTTCKMDPPLIVPAYSQFLDVIYYEVSYTIHYNPDGWQPEVPDQGFRALDQSVSPPQLKDLLDRHGQKATEPMFLDGTGNALTLPVGSSNPVFTTVYDIYEEADFNDLNFPDNIFITTPFGG